MSLTNDNVPTAADLLAEARSLFGVVPRPEHFTDYKHCCECAEHDVTFQVHTPDTIGHRELGNPGWDPVCFATPEAYRYYFPAFTRLAIEGSDDTYYVDQLLFHLNWDGLRHERWQMFNEPQRKFVCKLLMYLLETKSEEIDLNLHSDDLLSAIEKWSSIDP